MACLRSPYRSALALILTISLMAGSMGIAGGQEAQKIVEVSISGNVNINVDTIMSAVTLKPGDDYSDAKGENDRSAILSLGYFSVVTIHKEQVPGGVKIVYEVTENPKITAIQVLGSEPYSAQTILDIMKTRPGQVLNSNTLNQDIEAIQTYYLDAGYLAYVTEDIEVDPATGVLTVPVLVHRVQSIEITGNKKTRSFVFTREMKTKTGSVFNRKVLEEDYMRIANLDILEDIKMWQITPGDDPGQIKLTIPVVEKKTGQVSVGFGYSSRQRLVGQARLAETNFRGRGQGLNLLWEQGTTKAVGGSASYEIGFFEPWLDNKHTSLNVSLFNKIIYRFSSGVFDSNTFVDDEIYNERHKGGDLTVSRPLSDKTRLYLGGRWESVDTDPSLLSLTDDLYKIVQEGDITSGNLRLVHNNRDFDLDPGSGGYEALIAEFGSVDSVRFVETGISTDPFEEVPFNGAYSKFSADLRRYFSKGGPKKSKDDKRLTLAVRLRAGIGNGTIPFFEQFFVGGSESLRGYREDRFWGNNMLLASVELRKPVAQGITGVLFCDYGDAWNGDPIFDINELPQTQKFDGHVGVGAGIRVTTPIGHIRLDYGVGDEGGRTHFSMGHAF